MTKLIDFILTNYDLVVAVGGGLYELLVRVFPTRKNWSIIENAVKLLGMIIKNRREPDPLDKTPLGDDKVNRVTVARNKHIISVIVFMLLSLSSYGQLVGTFKGVRFMPAQDTTVLNANPSQYPIGTVIREINTDSLYYKFPDGFWHPLTGDGGGGGGSVTADNGLTATGNNVKLGGPLTEATTINNDNTTPFSVAYYDGSIANSISVMNFTSLSATETSSGNNTLINASPSNISLSATDFDNSSYSSLEMQGQSAVLYSTAEGLESTLYLTPTGSFTLSSIGNTGLSQVSGNDNTLDLTADNFTLNNVSPTSPTTEFFRADGTWAVPAGGGGATADNGLTETTGNIQLGGSLIQATTITGEAENLSLGTNSSRVNNFRLFGTDLGIISDDITITADGSPGGINMSSPETIIVQQSNDVNSEFFRVVKQQTLNSGVSGAIVNYTATTAGGSANGFGMRFDYNLSSTTGPIANVMRESVTLVDATTGSENVVWTKSIMLDGASPTPVMSIEPTTTHNIIIFNNLPTACTGLPTGALANVSGTLTVCP